MDKETYKREIVRMWDSLRSDEYKGNETCRGVKCKACPLRYVSREGNDSFNAYEIIEYAHKMIEAIEKWSKEHPQKHKVSQLEYDIMRAAIDYSSEEETFEEVDILYELLEGGYFNGAKSNDKIVDYIEKCEVVKDDQ